MQTKQLNISGMHCQACKTLIETEVKEMNGVKSINVDYKKGNSQVEFDESKVSQDDILQAIEKMNYRASFQESIIKKQQYNVSSKTRIIGIIVAFAIFILFYYFINLLGGWELMSKLNEPELSLSLMFLIGFIASFHCVGMCGGIIVSFNQGQKVAKRPLQSNLSYNLGRILSYSSVGFLLGAFGSIFNINPGLSGLVALFAASFMLLFGLSMLFEHKWTKKLLPKMPDTVAKFILKNKKDKSRGPFFIGLATALMPCGPMQAVQVFALSTGAAWSGALAMFMYALGTTPLLLGFGSVISWFSRDRVKFIMRFSGVLVIVLAIAMFNRSLAFFGTGELEGVTAQAEVSQEFQEVHMSVTYAGYQPNVLHIEKDKPVRWIIDGSGITGCTNEILLPEYEIKQKLTKGKTIIEFTPDRLGEIKFSCWMRMVWGKFVVS